MTGLIAASSSSPSEGPGAAAAPRAAGAFDAAVAIVRGLGESAVLWLWAAAVVSASPEHGFTVSFPGVAVPAMVAVMVGWWARRTGPVRRALVLVGAGAVGAAVQFSVLIALGGVPLERAGPTPAWSLDRPDQRFAAGMATVIALVVWARGLWLGVERATTKRARRSALVGGLILGVGALNVSLGLPDFDVGTAPAGAMVLLFSLCTATALALVRERDLEASVLGRAADRPGGVWLSVLALPLLLVAAAALVVGALGTLVAGPVADALGAVLGASRDLLTAAFDQVSRLDPSDDGTTPTTLSAPAPAPADRPGSILLPGATIAIVAVAAIAFGLWRLVRSLRQLPLLESAGPAGRSAPEVGLTVEDEATTVFSWSHLWAQLRGWLARLLARRSSAPPAAVHGAPAATVGPPADPVRRAYYDVLVAARTSGRAREATETTAELANRLGPDLPPAASTALGQLTAQYECVRYGPRPADAGGGHGGDADAPDTDGGRADGRNGGEAGGLGEEGPDDGGRARADLVTGAIISMAPASDVAPAAATPAGQSGTGAQLGRGRRLRPRSRR